MGHEPGKVFEELADITLVDVVLVDPPRIKRFCYNTSLCHSPARWKWPKRSEDSGIPVLKLQPLLLELRKLG